MNTNPNDRLQRQNLMAERLQDLLLKEYERRLKDGELSDTGLGQLQKLLMQAGAWNFDPNRIPQSLKDTLTSHINPEDLEDDDLDVIDIAQRRGSG